MRNKKGVSVLIGYILLIVIAITVAVTVVAPALFKIAPDPDNPYNECPEDVSIIIESASCDEAPNPNEIKLQIKNSGRFNIAGVYIRGSGDVNEVPTYQFNYANSEVITWPRDSVDNVIKKGEEIPGLPDLNYKTLGTNLVKIEVVPFRFEEREGKQNEIVRCPNARIVQEVSGCPIV
jgi:hypothetical protein